MPDHHVRAGASGGRHFDVAITPESAGWSESSLWILTLGPGEDRELASGPDEIIVLPLSGAAVVACGGVAHQLSGRTAVFEGPTDFAYVGRNSTYRMASRAGGRFALCGARARTALPFRYVPAADVAVELRGAGSCSRQVHNFGMPDVFDADSLIACEVITPGGNWSSYPPHKHDENSAHETALEEIYYFEIRDSGFGIQRVYGDGIDVLAEVRSGDAVLVPHGYHGPSIAAPGYDMYYLNVMAGPGTERAWRSVDDPAHSWIRHNWASEAVDPRLPLGGAGP